VFWGGCVVFWCSFWVGFWLSESLRGVFTPARNGRLQCLPYDGGHRSFRHPHLKTQNSPQSGQVLKRFLRFSGQIVGLLRVQVWCIIVLLAPP
jgi:hypothetical protein